MPAVATGPSLVFYDGTCGFCHGAVRFLLSHDPSGAAFRFAPLEGTVAARTLPTALRVSRPGSIVVRTAEGSLLTSSAAVRHLGQRLTGGWRLGARAFGLIPRPLADAGYDLVARVRHRLAPKPAQSCPVVPAALLARFEL